MEIHTLRCAGIAIVPKKSVSACICVDFRLLNEHEVYPLPKVDETLAQLAGAKVFGKLDANCGFWQIPLVSHLTTFITHTVDFASTNYNLVS